MYLFYIRGDNGEWVLVGGGNYEFVCLLDNMFYHYSTWTLNLEYQELGLR